MKKLITLEPHGIFHQILLAYTVLHCLETGIQNKDKALPTSVWPVMVS